MEATHDLCAREILETVPLIMRFIRAHMRRHRIAGLSVPQFRVMLFVSRCRGASLSAVAEHVGISLPSVSRMAGNLVNRGLLAREHRRDDRREISLSVTPRGEKALRTARKATQTELERQIAPLNAAQRRMIDRTMTILQPVFGTQSSQKDSLSSRGGHDC